MPRERLRCPATRRRLRPGRYTVILEPAAVLDLVGQIFMDFSGTAIADQRSFLNDRLGEKLFGSNITIYDDVAFPLQTGAPFDGEGVPRRALKLVKEGVPRQVAYSRLAAAQGRSRTDRPWLSVAERARRSAGEHRDRGRQHID